MWNPHRAKLSKLAEVGLLALLVAALPACRVSFPGTSFRGVLPEANVAQRAMADELRADVVMLAETIGERNTFDPPRLDAAAAYIERELLSAGYEVRRQTYLARGVASHNLEVELRGTTRPDEILVIGAHYDSVRGSPGANDNASGTAATLALARRFAGVPRGRTIRFVLFTNEEPPHFWTRDMGSLVYARACKERGENIVGMVSVETIGYHSEEEGTQDYPPPFSLFYPSTGDFIAFVGNSASAGLVSRVVRAFRDGVEFPSEGAAIPGIVPRVGSSDHWSFWKQGWQALMVTDTAPYRYPHYHKATDTPDKLDYDRMSRVVEGLEHAIDDLADPGRDDGVFPPRAKEPFEPR